MICIKQDLDAYKVLIDKLKSYNYHLIQYIPSRQSILLGQEKSVFLAFMFRRRACIFNSSLFLLVYLNLFRFFYPRIYLLYKIFYRGARFTKESLVNHIFSEHDFGMFARSGLFHNTTEGHRSCYRFIPLGEVILIGKFDEKDSHYIHTGYDTVITYDNMTRSLLDMPEIKKALEIGCGSGFLSVFMARKVKIVDAVDINPGAVQLTKINAHLNGMRNINVFESNVYERIEGRYDYIFSNPPFELLPEEKKDMLHSFGGNLGLEITTSIIEGLDKHLSESGLAHILSNTYIKDSGENTLKQKLEKVFSKKNFDITLKELSYQLRPEYYGYYKRKGIIYSISYFITIRRAPSYRLKIIPLGFILKIREWMRLLILRLIAKYCYKA